MALRRGRSITGPCAYRSLPALIAADGPIAAPRHDPKSERPESADPYNTTAYEGGFALLYAFRAKVGSQRFQQIERAWVSTYRNSSVGTAQFIDLASHIGGSRVRPFLQAWLYGTTPPPVPGHPVWTQSAKSTGC
jgi:aminopeptidase N